MIAYVTLNTSFGRITPKLTGLYDAATINEAAIRLANSAGVVVHSIQIECYSTMDDYSAGNQLCELLMERTADGWITMPVLSELTSH